MFKRIILALALLFTFANGAHAEADFLKSAIQMGTTYCPDASFDCNNITAIHNDIIAAANDCITSRMNISERIMSDFKMSGEHENCVLSEEPSKTSTGTSVWAICCVKKESDGQTCGMSCTRYISQK